MHDTPTASESNSKVCWCGKRRRQSRKLQHELHCTRARTYPISPSSHHAKLVGLLPCTEVVKAGITFTPDNG